MAKENETNAEQQMDNAAELAEQAKTEAEAKGKALERERINAINSSLEGDQFADIRNKAIAEDWSLERAKSEAFDASLTIHAEQLAAKDGELEKANAKLKAIAEGGSDIEAPRVIDHAEEEPGANGDDGKADTFNAAVKEFIAAGDTRAIAMRKAGALLPNSHVAWVKSQQKR